MNFIGSIPTSAAAATVASSTTNTTGPTRDSRPSNNSQLAPRKMKGGIEELVLISKILASGLLIFGICGMLAPTLILEFVYNFSSPTTRLSRALVEDMSGMITGIALATWTALFLCVSPTARVASSSSHEPKAVQITPSLSSSHLQTCLGLAGIPTFLLMAKWSLNHETPDFGMPIYHAYLLMIVLGIMVYNGLFQNQTKRWPFIRKRNILAFLSSFFAANGIVGTLFPQLWSAAFGIEQLDLVDITLSRMLAASIGGLGLLMHGFLPFIIDHDESKSKISSDQRNIHVDVVTNSLVWAIAPTLLNWATILIVGKEVKPTGMVFYLIATIVCPSLVGATMLMNSKFVKGMEATEKKTTMTK